MKTLKTALKIIIGVPVIGFVLLMIFVEAPPPSANTPTANGSAVAPRPDLSPPIEQAEFTRFLKAHSAAFSDAGNALARGDARAARAKALCSGAAPIVATNWIGSVRTVYRAGGGRAGVEIDLSGTAGVRLQTHPDEHGPLAVATQIAPNEPLHDRLAGIRERQRVRFDAEFRQGGRDCLMQLREESTVAMMAPYFVVRVTDIRPF